MLPSQADLYINKIKTNFTNPIAFHTNPDDPEAGYCVGGALCLTFGNKIKDFEKLPLECRFPAEEEIGDCLICLNPELDYTTSDKFAQELIDYNDTGDYNSAWDIIFEALTFRTDKDDMQLKLTEIKEKEYATAA